MSLTPLSGRLRLAVLAASFAGLLFDGMELGLMPVASLSVSKSLLGPAFTASLGGDWFARFTASLMLGAALGGIALGHLGDRLGRSRAMGISILFYSVFAGLGAYAQTQEQMLVLRFLVGLGVGGMWPNGVALVSECWPDTAKPIVAGIMGAGINTGILLLSQIVQLWPITPDSWRWIFRWSAIPGALGLLVLLALPESPGWLRSRDRGRQPAPPLATLFRPPLRRLTLLGILLGTVPLVGAWAASKWMIPWADKVAGLANPKYKAVVQQWWAVGATLGSFLGAQVAGRFGRRLTYAAISVGALGATLVMFLASGPLEPGFLAVVGVQGFIATLFFGWLPLYLPELFPVHVRATGVGTAYNSGRFLTAAGVFLAGGLFTALGGDYRQVGAICALVYGLGLLAIWRAPERGCDENGAVGE